MKLWDLSILTDEGQGAHPAKRRGPSRKGERLKCIPQGYQSFFGGAVSDLIKRGKKGLKKGGGRKIPMVQPGRVCRKSNTSFVVIERSGAPNRLCIQRKRRSGAAQVTRNNRRQRKTPSQRGNLLGEEKEDTPFSCFEKKGARRRRKKGISLVESSYRGGGRD